MFASLSADYLLPLQVETKTTTECVDFYYTWKKSSHYMMWKEYGKPTKKFHTNKEEQWAEIRAKMNGVGSAVKENGEGEQKEEMKEESTNAAIKSEENNTSTSQRRGKGGKRKRDDEENGAAPPSS